MRQKTQHFDIRQTMQCSKYEIFHYNEPAATEVKIHNHDFYEVFFLLDGDISYWMEDELSLTAAVLVTAAVFIDIKSKL